MRGNRSHRISDPAASSARLSRSVFANVDVNDVILSKKQTAELVQVSERTLERLEEQRRGPARRKVGNQIRYLKSRVLAWMAEEAR